MDYASLYPYLALRAQGAFGDLFIFKDYKTYKLVTKFYYPENPRTPEQQGFRSVFHDGVKNWQGFDAATKSYYNELVGSAPMLGYNKYLSLYLKANYPMIIYWGTLEKSATDPAKIPDYIATPYFMRGLDISPVSWDGWLQAKETWTRTGNHTFTISGNVTAKYSKGTRIRYKQGGAYEYGVVISAIYGAPNTTVTLATNTDYAMAAGTITDNYYSYASCPQGYPQWFNLADPTFNVALYDDGAGGQPTTTEYRLSINGKIATVHYKGNGIKAGTNPYITITAPTTMPTPVNTSLLSVIGSGLANGPDQPAAFAYDANPYAFIFSSNITDNTVITSLSFTAIYEI